MTSSIRAVAVFGAAALLIGMTYIPEITERRSDNQKRIQPLSDADLREQKSVDDAYLKARGNLDALKNSGRLAPELQGLATRLDVRYNTYMAASQHGTVKEQSNAFQEFNDHVARLNERVKPVSHMKSPAP